MVLVQRGDGMRFKILVNQVEPREPGTLHFRYRNCNINVAHLLVHEPREPRFSFRLAHAAQTNLSHMDHVPRPPTPPHPKRRPLGARYPPPWGSGPRAWGATGTPGHREALRPSPSHSPVLTKLQGQRRTARTGRSAAIAPKGYGRRPEARSSILGHPGASRPKPDGNNGSRKPLRI